MSHINEMENEVRLKYEEIDRLKEARQKCQAVKEDMQNKKNHVNRRGEETGAWKGGKRNEYTAFLDYDYKDSANRQVRCVSDYIDEMSHKIGRLNDEISNLNTSIFFEKAKEAAKKLVGK